MLCIIGDAHLGYRQYGLDFRERDFFEAFSLALKRGAEAGAAAFIQLGDFFHVFRPSHSLLLEVAGVVEEVGKPVYVVHGNHDLPRRDASPLQVLSKMTGGLVMPVTGPEEPVARLDLEGFSVVAIGYVSPVDEEKVAETVARAKELLGNSKPSILVAHLDVNAPGIFMGPRALNIKELAFADVVVLGHYHDATPPMELDGSIWWFAGSTEVTSVTESWRKCIYLVGEKIVTIEIPARPVIRSSDPETTLRRAEELLRRTGKKPVILVSPDAVEVGKAVSEVAAAVVEVPVGASSVSGPEETGAHDVTIPLDEFLRRSLEEEGVERFFDDVRGLLLLAEEAEGNRSAASELRKAVSSFIKEMCHGGEEGTS